MWNPGPLKIIISIVIYSLIGVAKFLHNRAVIEHFMKMGATEVCFTLGDKGCWVGNNNEKHYLPSREVTVKDTTGAGDAFWSGYLTARLDGKTLLERAISGRKMAELKLGHFGPLPEKVDRNLIYSDLT